jgi:hypothetical protein
MNVAQNQTAPNGGDPGEVHIVAHSMVFYWWPVWAVGLLLAGLSGLAGQRLAIVPVGTQVMEGFDGGREALVLPAGAHLPQDPSTGKPREPTLRVASRSGYGVAFIVVLLLVVFITNVPIRGLWSLLVVLGVLLVTIILALADLWDDILEAVAHSQVYINAFGYLAISLPLLVLWLVVVLYFDRKVYMIFVPGQMRVRQEIGSGEIACDTMGMVVAKRRSDLFRHWLLGFGSGDLVVKSSGAHSQQFEMQNVLFVGKKLKLILLSGVAPEPVGTGAVMAQVMPSGPDYPATNVQRLVVALVHAAQERVVITTPYFIPDDPLLVAMETAVRRGVEVHLVVSQIADQILVSLAQKSYYEQLLEAGVHIHLYREKFLHAKHLSIDGAIAVIGSSNMDIRSFVLNAEVSLIVYDAEVTARVREQQERYFATSDRLSRVKWMKRSLVEKICENLARLMSPLL